MSLLQEAFYGGVLIGLITAVVIRASIQLIKEIIAENRTTKNA